MTGVAITGARGFVGRAVAAALNERSALHVALSRSEHSPYDDRTALAAAMMGAQAVIHTAGLAHNPELRNDLDAQRRVNCDLAVRVAQCAARAGVQRMVHLSTIAVHGVSAQSTPLRETSPIAPVSAYGRAKAEAEDALQKFCDEQGMTLTIFRLPLIYGRGAPGNFSRLAKLAQTGLPLPFGAVTNRRSMLAIGNLTGLLIKAAVHDRPGTFLVSDDRDLSTTSLLRLIYQGLRRRARLVAVPSQMLDRAMRICGKGELADQLLHSLELDITAVRQEFAWIPDITPEEAIPAAVDSSIPNSSLV